MTSLVENNKGFVIKLVFPPTENGNSQQQIRRVKLARIVDRKGEVSYGSLIRLATKFLSENDVNDLDLDTFSLGGDLSTAGSIASCVALEYQDEDGDTITITSTDELLDAIDQFTGKQVLRLTARVVLSPQRGGSSFVSHLTGVGTASDVAPSNNVRIQTEPKSVNAFGASASRDDTGVVPPEPAPAEPKKPEATTKHATVVPGTVAPPQGRVSPDQSVKNVEKQISGMVDTVVTAFAKAVINLEESLDEIPRKINSAKRDKEAKSTNERSVASNDDGQDNQGEEKVVKSSPKKEEEEAAPENEMPFIHGRHTCDSCLVSPIVGTRYRATNRLDYDLCQRCFTNYQGDEIKFKQTQDDRDVGFQSRWHDRRCQEQEAAEAGFVPTPENNEPIGSDEIPVRSFIHGRHTCDNCLATPIVGKRYHAVNRPNYDVCEACYDSGSIPGVRFEVTEDARDRPFQDRWHRRSHRINARNRRRVGRWHHIKAKKAAAQAARSQEYDPALVEAIRRSLSDTGPKEAIAKALSAEAKAKATQSDTVVAEPEAAPEASKLGTTPVLKPQPSAPLEEEVNSCTEDVDREASAGEDASDEKDDKKPGVKDEPEAVERVHVGSTQLKDPPVYDAPADSKPPAVVLVREGEEKACPTSPTGTNDHSFESDAEGSGDVAEALGATFDKVASVIDAMLEDAHESYKESLKKESQEEDQWALVSKREPVTQPGEAQNPDDCDIVVHSEEDEDDGLARAAEMIGSSLFNSEISEPSGAGSGNGVTEEQRQRWATQLAQLRELGFSDEASCVEALDRIQAAYIGSDLLDEEVTVTQVVHELLKDA